MDFARNLVSSILDNNGDDDEPRSSSTSASTSSSTAYSSSYSLNNNNINNTGTTRSSTISGTTTGSTTGSGRRLGGGGVVGSRSNRFFGSNRNNNNNNSNQSNTSNTSSNNNNNNSDQNNNNNESNNNSMNMMANEAAQYIAINLSSLFGGGNTTTTDTNTTTTTTSSSSNNNTNSTARTNPQQQQQQQTPSVTATPDKIPPISNRVLNKLPLLTITKDDLIDSNNRQCSICFDDIQLYQKVVRLIPYCGHTFCCVECIKPWLLKQATCPVCRYELPTDAGYNYEQQRQIRMSYRKPRLSKYDLQYRLTISELKQLLSLHELRTKLVSSSSNDKYLPNSRNNNNNNKLHFTEKQDIINYIIEHDDMYVDWITLPDPVQYTMKQLTNMSISQLKYVMNNEGGVFFENQVDIVEKSDMIQYFIVSKRLIIIPENENDNDNNTDEMVEDTEMNNDINHYSVNNNIGNTKQVSFDRITVETVYDNDDDICDNNGLSSTNNNYSTNNPIQDERIDPDILMEENYSF